MSVGQLEPIRAPGRVTWTGRDHQPWLTFCGVAIAAASLWLGIFGVPRVDLHAPPHYLGVMDPLCGMTRALHAFVTGDLQRAWRYNPGVFVVAVAAALLLLRAAVGVTTKRWVSAGFLSSKWTRLTIALFVVSLWINQQLNAPLLMGP